METPTPTTPASQPGNGSGVAANPPTPQQAAATAISPDPVTADILRRHAAGEKLTPSEGGKLGAFKRGLKKAASAVGLASAERPEPNPFSPSAVRIPVATVSPGETPGGGLPAVPVDAGFARRTALVTLNKIDAVTTRWVTREARAAGISGDALADITSKASLAGEDKNLVADLAPDICAELGVDPRKSPLLVAGAVLTAHSASLLMAVMEIREMKEKEAKREQERRAAAAAAAQSSAATN